MWKIRFSLPLVALNLFISLSSGCDSHPNQALGTLERERVLLKATASEIIVDTPASKGQKVNKGDLLIQLDSSRQQLAVNRAQANKDAATALLQKLQHGAREEEVAAQTALWNQTRVQADETERQYSRARSLWDKRLVSQADFDKAKTQFTAAKAEQERAYQNLLTLTKGTRPEDLAQAKAQLDQAESQHQLELRLLDDLSIRATRNGQLDDLPKHTGERAQQGDVLAVLLAASTPYARVYIPEAARVKVIAGNTLSVHVDGVTAAFTGKVRWVSQDPAFTPYYALNSNDRSRLVYLAEIDLPDTAKDLPSGVPVQVDLPK